MSKVLKKLIIMISAIKENIHFTKNEDVLALTLLTMESAKQNEIKYLTTEDFYPRSLINKDEEEFQLEMKNWLKTCDDIFKPYTGYECSFSGNGYWFFARFESFHYISRLSTKISERYESIEFDIPSEFLKKFNPTTSIKDLSFFGLGTGLDHFVYFLILSVGKCNVVNIRGLDFGMQKNKLNSPYKDFIKRLPEIIVKRSKLKLSSIVNKKIIKNGNFWVPQAGYDVDRIKFFFPEYNYINICNIIISDFNSKLDINIDIETMIKVNKFIEERLIKLAGFGKEFVQSYIDNIVSYIPEIINLAKKNLSKQKPKAVLYALGSANIVDQIVGRVANENNVPVYYFKHGGIENAFLRDSILDLYFEYSSFLNRTHFFHSSIEFKKFDNPNIFSKVLSPVNDFKINISKIKPNRKILYSVGPPSNWSFKDLFKYCLDSERKVFIDNMISLSKEHKLKIDIKVHPAEWHRSYDFFKLLNNNCDHKFNILAGGTIERIFKNYGIVVLDIFCSKVFSALLYSKMPIIVWKPEGVELNKDYESILRNRVNVVTNYKELETVLKLFLNGELNYNFENFNEIVFSNTSQQSMKDYLFEEIIKNE